MLTPMPRQLLGGDIDAISRTLHGGRHDAESLLSHRQAPACTFVPTILISALAHCTSDRPAAQGTDEENKHLHALTLVCRLFTERPSPVVRRVNRGRKLASFGGLGDVSDRHRLNNKLGPLRTCRQ